ncbi:MAG: 30S ribosomal protein S18 [Elusimicrobiota bacterium]
METSQDNPTQTSSSPVVAPASRPGGFRGDRPGGAGRPGPGPRRGRYFGGRGERPRKACRFCVEHKETLDYKDVALVRNFVTERGKILPSRISGTCARHQRRVRDAVKMARIMALLPFATA